MRNLLEYPLSAEEVLSALQHALEERTGLQLCGDIDSVALYTVLKWFEDNPHILREMLEETRMQ